jgi:hypothetical protein
MGKLGQKQRAATHVVRDVSPDDVLNLIRARDQRLRADPRTDLEKYFGNPVPSRSALVEYRARQAARPDK